MVYVSELLNFQTLCFPLTFWYCIFFNNYDNMNFHRDNTLVLKLHSCRYGDVGVIIRMLDLLYNFIMQLR